MAYKLTSRKPLPGSQIDYSHPLAKGLSYFALCTQYDTKQHVMDFGPHKLHGIYLGVADNVNIKGFNENGSFLRSEDSPDYAVDLGTRSRTLIDTSNDRMSAVSLMRHNDESDSFEPGNIISKRDGSTSEFHFYVATTTPANHLGFKRGAPAGNITGGVLEEKVSFLAGLSYENGTATGYVDGRRDPNTRSGFPTSSRLDINAAWGARWNSYPTTTKGFDGEINFVILWDDRVLTEADHAAIAADPFQMFEHRATGLWIFVQTLAQEVTTTFIASGLTLSAPTLAYGVDAALITSGVTLFGPTVLADQSITTAFIASGSSLNVASLAYQMITAAIAGGSALFAVTVSPGPVTITGVHIASTVALNTPSLAHQVDTAAIAAGSALFTVTVFPTTLEQEGYRWRDDDGSEVTATWRQLQDVDDSVTLDTNIRLRVLLNASGDPASSQFQLEYRKVGNGGWKKVNPE